MPVATARTAKVRGAYPAPAGNRTVLMANTTNLYRVVLRRFLPRPRRATRQPHGMPPFAPPQEEDDLP